MANIVGSNKLLGFLFHVRPIKPLRHDAVTQGEPADVGAIDTAMKFMNDLLGCLKVYAELVRPRE